MILIADSGSTKTDWTLVDGRTVQRLRSEGITPLHQDESAIEAICKGVARQLVSPPKRLFFYGSGVIPAKREPMRRLLARSFGSVESVEAENDLLGAARALCGRDEGIACILGTGANSCLYDGVSIVRNTPPLGYILGDEGSGAVLGRDFLRALFRGELPSVLRDEYLRSVGTDYVGIIERVYRQPMANRFLASASLFIRGHVEEYTELHALVVDNFCRFLSAHVGSYGRFDLPVHAVGSVAWHYRGQLAEAVARFGMRMGTVQQSPMDGLVAYHDGLAKEI